MLCTASDACARSLRAGALRVRILSRLAEVRVEEHSIRGHLAEPILVELAEEAAGGDRRGARG